MADTRITDLVDPEEIKKLQELDAELRTVLRSEEHTSELQSR